MEDAVKDDKEALLAKDKLVPDLLSLPARARPWLHGLPEVEEGLLVLQDRSSCLSALSAGLTPGTFLLDACAAPGSKTAHAIELLGGRGRAIAFEQSPRRAVTLVSRLRQLLRARRSGLRHARALEAEDAWFNALDETSLQPGTVMRLRADGIPVAVHVGDFLSCNPLQPPFCDVEVLIVDPSCSGSGLPDHYLGGHQAMSATRLRGLASFQRRILAHALRFPAARTVVYSTCSLHQEENEEVVQQVLSGTPAPPFKVVQALPSWKNAALPGRQMPSWTDLCLRCDPATHGCRGFFLCRLDRLPEGAVPAPPAPLERLVKRPHEATASEVKLPKKKRRKGKAAKDPSCPVAATALPEGDRSKKRCQAKTHGLRLGKR